MKVTIFESIFEKKPHYISVDGALARIRDGKNATRVAELRATLDKTHADLLKKQLPAVAFAGCFATRGDKHLTSHSGFLVLDFDKLDDLSELAAKLYEFPSTYAYWLSPSGNGLKALIRIADGTKHREHFAALREVFPNADPSGVNEERLCFESYDPQIHINKDAKPFTGILTVRQTTERVEAQGNDSEKFQKLLKWITNKAGAFAAGSRNTFIFKLAGACCRFGLDVQSAGGLISAEFPTANDFTTREMLSAVKSAYRANASLFGTVKFEQERVIDIKSRKEVKIKELPEFDPEAPPRDVIYAADVKAQALDIYENGYGFIKGIEVEEFDKRWKLKRGEVTCLTGYGNAGKSALYKWYQLMRCLMYGERFASFSPEDNPTQEYYHDFVEMLLAADCTPTNPHKPPREAYDKAYDWVGRHIHYLYPQDDSPTPEYIKERFLELIIKEKIDGVCIDPFNQLSNDYGARSDKYLEGVLGDFSRFAQKNNVYFVIVAHPKQPSKDANGNYPCPDRFDLADGAMWNNKMDNIIVYHRPFIATNPDDPACEFHSKKVKRQKTVGRPGFTEARYVRTTRRFEFGSDDPMERVMKARGLDFYGKGIPATIPQVQQPSSPLILPDDFWND